MFVVHFRPSKAFGVMGYGLMKNTFLVDEIGFLQALLFHTGLIYTAR
jgi:hypothetical protein